MARIKRRGPSEEEDSDNSDVLISSSENELGSDSDDEQDDTVDISTLTEVEKEKYFLEKYEREEQSQKKKELKRQLKEAKQGKTRRKTDKSKRKQALSALKNAKKEGTQLSGWSDDEDGQVGDGDGKFVSQERYQVRKKRRELSLHAKGQTDDGQVFSDEVQEEEGSEDLDDDSPPITYEQAIHYLQKKVEFFKKMYFEPSFDSVIKGNYVRVKIGMNEGNFVYRFCEVLSACMMSKEYTFNNEVTKKGLMLAYGNDRKAWRINSVSNKSITKDEFDHWCRKLDSCNKNIMSRSKARAFRIKNDKMLANKGAISAKDFNEMLDRKKSAGQVKVKLGVQRVRLERDLLAAEHAGELEKGLTIKAQLTEIEFENARRETKKRDEVTRLNEINMKNRLINQQRDMEAQRLNQVERDNMTTAERLQYTRSKSDKLYLSKSIIDGYLKDGKLVEREDGVITTANKRQVVEALPDNLHKSKNASPEKEKRKTLEEKAFNELQPEKATKYFDENKNEITGPISLDQKKTLTMQHFDKDGTVTTYMPVTALKPKQKPQGKANKRKRAGITLTDYYSKANVPPVDNEQ